MKSKSALTPNTSRDQMLPGRIYMHFLPEKNLYWPVRLVDISRQKSRTPPKATFEVISGSLGTYKFANHKIQLPLNSQSLKTLVPFQSVYSDKNTIQLAIEDGSLSQKRSKEYTAAMNEAAKAFEHQLKTPAMYQLLKANDKKSYRNQQANNQNQPTRLGPFFSQILNNRHAPQKVTFNSRSSSKPLPSPIPQIPDPKLSSNLQSASSISSSQKYTQFTNDLKRSHSKTKIDQNSIQSLQCIKKKRNIKNNTSSIEFQAESSSSISKLSRKFSSKMLAQKNSLQSQSHQRNKSSKSNNTKDKPKKVKIKNDQFSEKREKLSAKQGNHIKKVQTKKQEPLRIAKTQKINNITTSNLKTKAVIQKPKITTNVQNSTKFFPKDVIFEIEKCEFQNSRVSSRTRSKKISNTPINIQLDKINLKGRYSASVKIEPQSQKEKNIKKQKQTDSKLKDTKGISPKNKINSKPSPSLQPQSGVVQPKNLLGSENGQQLGVQNIFFLFRTLFNHQYIQQHFKRQVSKRKNPRNFKQSNRPNQPIKLFACIMNEQNAKEIHREKEREKNKTQLSQKQQELSEQLFQVKNQESDDNISFPVNFTQSPSVVQNASIKLEKIVEEKHQPKIKTQQWENKPFIFKDNFATVSETTNTEPTFKNQTFTEQLSVKYKMVLICSFDDVLNLIKKHLSEENNLKKIPFSNKKGKNQKIVLESNNLESESNKANDKKTVFFVVEKHNARLSLDLAKVWKKKMIKKPKRANKNRRGKREAKSEDQSQKASECVNTLVQESLHLFPVDKMLLHGLFGNFQNLQMSIFQNQILTKDLSKYDGSQYHFFSSLFPRLIGQIEIDGKTKKQLEFNSKYSQSSRKSGSSKAKTSKSLIHSNKKDCKHELCAKMTAPDKAIVQNIQQMLSMNKSCSGLEMENKFYRKQIIHDCESILQLFAIQLSDQQKNNDNLGLSQKSFKHTFFSLIYKNLKRIMAQNIPSCFYSKILICIARVFSILSYEVNQIKTIDKSQKIVKNENKTTNPKQLISIGSNLKRHNQSKPSSMKNSNQIQLNTPMRIQNSVKFNEIHTSPFSFDFSGQNCYASQQNSSIQSLNSSGKTEFDRNTSDFTSFLTKVLPQVDVQKHQRNFRKNNSPFFSHDHQKGDISFGSSLKQYSQNKNHYQKEFMFDNDDTESGMNFSYPSSHSVLVNNSKQTETKSQQNSASLKVPNSLQASTNQKKTSPNSEVPRIFNEISSSSRCSHALTDDQLKEQMIEMLQQWIADDVQIDNRSRLFR